MTENESQQPKPRLSRLAIASFYCFLAGVTIFIMGSGMVYLRLPTLDSFLGIVFSTMMVLGFVVAPALGIAATISIARSDGALCGTRRAMAATLIPSAFAILSGLSMLAERNTSHLPYQMLCGTNMKGLANAFLVYSQDNNDNLPDPSKWCDLLVTKADISPASFLCKASDSVRYESSYAMNIAAGGMKLTDVPKDMVLLFEVAPDANDLVRDIPVISRGFAQVPEFASLVSNSGNRVFRSRWNQACGPQRIAILNHGSGCNILFGDMHVEFVKADILPSLRWTTEGKVIFTVKPFEKPQVRRNWWPVYLILAASAAVVWLLVILCMRESTRTLAFFLTVAIVAGLVGAFFGNLCQQAHQSGKPEGHAGAFIGLVVGLVAGPSYTAFLRAKARKITQLDDAHNYAVATGMVTGIVCAIIVHLPLMAIYQGGRIEGLLHGPYFGIAAGGFVGLVAAFFLRPRKMGSDPIFNGQESGDRI